MKRQVMTPQLKRQLILTGIISLLLASALVIYVFGFTSDFIVRWLRSFFVFFVLIAATRLAIIPGVNTIMNRIGRW